MKILLRLTLTLLALSITLGLSSPAVAQSAPLHQIHFYAAKEYHETYGLAGTPGAGVHLSGSGYFHLPGHQNHWVLSIDGLYVEGGSFGTSFVAPMVVLQHRHRSHLIEARVYSSFGEQLRRWTVGPH